VFESGFTGLFACLTQPQLELQSTIAFELCIDNDCIVILPQ